MTLTEWAVVVGGVLTIAWINWYFFLAPADVRGLTVEDEDEG